MWVIEKDAEIRSEVGDCHQGSLAHVVIKGERRGQIRVFGLMQEVGRHTG